MMRRREEMDENERTFEGDRGASCKLLG